MVKNIQSNIWKLYVVQGLRSMFFMVPILILFFQDYGLSMQEILLLQSIFALGIIMFEIPSGYFSDVIGRKKTIISGCILGFIGLSIYSIAHEFWGFLIGELIIGFGMSLLSGTDSAMLYDTLVEIHKKDTYKKTEGKIMAMNSIAESFSSVVGGGVALISLKVPLYIEMITAFLAIVFAFTLIEPKRQKYENKNGAMQEIFNIIKYSVYKNKKLIWLIIYTGIIGASFSVVMWMIQPYFKLVGVPLEYFGVLWAVFTLSIGMFAVLSDYFEKIVGKSILLILLTGVSIIGYIVLSIFQSLWVVIFFLLFYFTIGISTPLVRYYININITSDKRATVLSFKSLVGRLLFIIIGPFIGWVNDMYSLPMAFMISGLIFSVLGIIALLFLYKHKVIFSE